ncbi:MAG TPA: NUDIX domain-containing protein [Chthonomonadales bacterium]|nr:NUDIX domain-containing protein [Chthonomonadales bacterium]
MRRGYEGVSAVDGALASFRRCPSCGSDEGSATSAKRWACRACGFEFFQNAAAAVIAIVRRPDGAVLFTRRARPPAEGKLDLPGGFVDPGEAAEGALRREVLEEVGLQIEEARFLASFPNRYLYAGVLYHTLDLVFDCHVIDPRAAAASDEVTATEWRDPCGVAPEELSFDSVRAAVRLLI